MISKIEEDLEFYTKKFKQFKSQYKETLQQVDEILFTQNKGEEYVLRENNTYQANEYGRFEAIPNLKPAFLEKKQQWLR